jgi:hypothetical protein
LESDAPKEGVRLCAVQNIPEKCQCDDYFFSLRAVAEVADREHTVEPGAGRKLVRARFAWVMVSVSEAHQASQAPEGRRGGLGQLLHRRWQEAAAGGLDGC